MANRKHALQHRRRRRQRHGDTLQPSTPHRLVLPGRRISAELKVSSGENQNVSQIASLIFNWSCIFETWQRLWELYILFDEHFLHRDVTGSTAARWSQAFNIFPMHTFPSDNIPSICTLLYFFCKSLDFHFYITAHRKKKWLLLLLE